MTVVPPLPPVTIPVVAPIVATAALPLLQLPPGVLLLRVVVAPWHTAIEPVMGVGTITATVVVV